MGEPVRVINVPPDYSTPSRCSIQNAGQPVRDGGSKGSGGEYRGDCYVYHLDDDTHIGRDTAASLAEFIELDGDRFSWPRGS